MEGVTGVSFPLVKLHRAPGGQEWWPEAEGYQNTPTDPPPTEELSQDAKQPSHSPLTSLLTGGLLLAAAQIGEDLAVSRDPPALQLSSSP